MIPAWHYSSRPSETLPVLSPPVNRDAGQITLAIQHQGRSLLFSLHQAEQAKQQLKPDARLLVDKALRALSGTEPMVNLKQNAAGGAFDFYASQADASYTVFEHDSHDLTGLTIHDRLGNILAGIDMSANGKAKLPKSPPADSLAMMANEVSLPLLIDVGDVRFKVGALKRKIDPVWRSRFIQAINTEPKNIVHYIKYDKKTWISFTIDINQTHLLVTLEADAQDNLLGASGSVYDSGAAFFTLELNPVSHIISRLREGIVLKSQASMLENGSVWTVGGLEFSEEEPVKTSFKAISHNNMVSIRHRLGELAEYESVFVQRLLSQPFFATHATSSQSAIDRADGGVSLFSRTKLQQRNIPFNQLHTMEDDMTLVAGEDQVYFSLECGSRPQKTSSRFGNRLLRFNLEHPVFRDLAILTLADPNSADLPDPVGRFHTVEQYYAQSGDEKEEYNAMMKYLKYRYCDPFKTVFHGKQMREGIALHIISVLRKSVSPALASKMLEQEEINTLVNGLFRPQIMVPRHFFGWPDDEAIVRHDPSLLGE